MRHEIRPWPYFGLCLPSPSRAVSAIGLVRVLEGKQLECVRNLTYQSRKVHSLVPGSCLAPREFHFCFDDAHCAKLEWPSEVPSQIYQLLGKLSGIGCRCDPN
jgi:hypothetical protein